jgi:hypothetical protein
MFTVDISEIQENYKGPMLIVCEGSGVRHEAQVAGISCVKAHQRGILVPLIASEENCVLKELANRWYQGSDAATSYAEHREILERLLSAWELNKVLKPMVTYTAEMFDMCAWGEAWLPVRVSYSVDRLAPNGTALKALKGFHAILTYQNSD